MKTITFRNLVQVALFDEELRGQLSDGYWENTRPLDHWRPWCDATAVVAKKGEIVGRNFYADKDNYAFDSSKLLECVGDRMLEICRRVAGAGFTMKMMKEELRDMKTIIKLYN